MAGPTQPPTPAGRGVEESTRGPARAGRLTRERLGESAADYLRHVQVKTLRLADIVIEPHRVHLDRARVDRLARAIPDFCGIAVAYRPGAGYVLVGGEHRAAALAQRNSYEVPVYVLSSWRDFVAWMIADLDRPGGLGWTAVDAAHLHNKVVPLLAPHRSEKPGLDIAEYAGVLEGAIGNLRYAIAAANDPLRPAEVRREIADLIAGIARGGDGMHGAREAVQRIEKRHEAARTPAPPADKQRQMLKQALSTLEGLLSGLDHLGKLNAELSQEEREAFAFQIGRANARLSAIKTTLRRSGS